MVISWERWCPEISSFSGISRSHIKDSVVLRLWGMSAGRCEICNKLLYLDSYFGDDANFAEKAHIHAVGATGPRHRDDMTQDEINRIDNLMLLCEEHHHLIDTKPENYPGDYLVHQKAAHEDRIRKLTEIRDYDSCKMVTFFSNIDDVTMFTAENMLRRAVVKDSLYPKQDVPISLNEGSPTKYVPSKEIIAYQAKVLEDQVRINLGNLKKEDAIAVFALAPHPLLIKLGTLLSDQLNVHVFQCHRETEKWAWPEDNSSVDFLFHQTMDNSNSEIALVIDISAEIVDERITAVLGEECSVYHLTIDEPNRLLVKNKRIQDAFVRSFRTAMETIKNDNRGCNKVHLFPAMPQSLAIRAGMDFMPKADLPMLIYEHVNTEIGFIDTITIGGDNIVQ